MADAQYGVTKVNGFVATGVENLTSNFEFITSQMRGTDIRPAANGGNATSQACLDKLIQIVSERGQPVIMGGVSGGSHDTIILAIEHPHAWQCIDGDTNNKLQARINSDGQNYWSSSLNATITFSDVLT